MNIAVIGYGMMGQSHIKALKAMGHSVKLVIGRDLGRTKQFAMENGIPFYGTSFASLVTHEIQVVHICTPPANHYALIKQALEHHMHVICEKPFVLDNAEGEELVQLVKRNNLIGAVGFNVRYHEACQHAKLLVEKGQIGEVLLVHGSYLQEFHALPAFYSWRYQPESAGSMLATTEIGSHWIDLMRYLTGKDIEAVSANFRGFFSKRILSNGMMYHEETAEGEPVKVDSENVALLNFRLTGGSLANVVLSEITPGRYNYLDMTVTGSKGSFWWNSEELNRLHMGKKSLPVETEVLAFADGFGSSVQKMLEAIYYDIEKEDVSTNPSYATFEDGLMNTKICNAIYKSAFNEAKWEVI